MRKSKTLEKIRNHQLVKICSLGHFIPSYVRHAAAAGFDCIWLDCEHRTWENRELQSLLAFFHLSDIDCMLRSPTTEKTQLYRYLEDGATGLMCPHVNDGERARHLRDCTKFPPLGDRGIDSAGLDSDFYLQGGLEYTQAANEETFLILQIETIAAVENAEDIISTEGVDGVFVGPGDLGLRIERNGADFDLEEAIEKVAALCKQYDKPWGLPVSDMDIAQKRYAQGGRLLAYGGEFMVLKDMLDNHAAELETLEN
ncbi:MAG: aldolase/citrate lyase family protein [Planctomycetota bacterium]|nr:aldolase/citrate lyase family protein [Planctomycetota bacterium]